MGGVVLIVFMAMLSPLPVGAQTAALDPGTYFEGEFIVQYEAGRTPVDIAEQVDTRAQRSETLAGKLQNAREDFSLSLSGEPSPEELQISLQNIENSFAATKAEQVATEPQTYLYTFDEARNPEDIEAVIDAYKDLPVEYVQPNFKYYMFDAPNDPDYTKQWGLLQINTEPAWARTKGSNTVKVGIIDSGIDRNHPDLLGNVVKSHPIAPGCINDGDSNGHGSHVAGVIGAMTNNAQGIAGMNWSVSLYGYCVVSPTGYGSSLTISQGIQQAIADGVHVINMSLGGAILPGMDPAVENAINQAAAKGIVLVAAAGNCGHLPPGTYPLNPECYWGGDADKYLPGGHPKVITVAALGSQNEHPIYSSPGKAVAVSAPGGNPSGGATTCALSGSDCIYSTWDRFKTCPATGSPSPYCPVAGTSMAAPYVTGLVALIKSINMNYTPTQIKDKITQSTDDLGKPGKDLEFGYGRINVAKALQGLLPGPSPITSVTPTPPSGTPSPSKCVEQRRLGDYNCDLVVNLTDFESWRQDFVEGTATLTQFEAFRKAFTSS